MSFAEARSHACEHAQYFIDLREELFGSSMITETEALTDKDECLDLVCRTACD